MACKMELSLVAIPADQLPTDLNTWKVKQCIKSPFIHMHAYWIVHYNNNFYYINFKVLNHINAS